jgi:hypothetical protein
MHLDGSCYCRAVRFSVEAYAPVPFMRCYCSICRKTAGGGGYAINLGAKAATLKVTGKRHIGLFHAVIDGVESEGERRFCRKCGSALWVWNPSWPELVHPFASAIDTPLPAPPSSVHILLDSKAGWVKPAIGRRDESFDGYPDESLEAWHRRHKLLSKA